MHHVTPSQRSMKGPDIRHLKLERANFGFGSHLYSVAVCACRLWTRSLLLLHRLWVESEVGTSCVKFKEGIRFSDFSGHSISTGTCVIGVSGSLKV